MDLKDRFFGKGSPEPGGPPVANPLLSDPPSFQLLYPESLGVESAALTQYLRDYHPELGEATAEVEAMPAPPPLQPGMQSAPGILGLIGWGRHVVKLVGFQSPIATDTLDRSVQPAHYDPELKEAALHHASHVLLYYAGYETDPLEQHVALAASAAALARFGALVTINDRAHTSIPAQALLPHEEDGGDTLNAMRTLPLPFLYAGFVKIEIDGEPGVWMRTFGCHVFALPDLVIQADSHNQGTATFNLFAGMLDYLRDSGQTFVSGDTLRVGEDAYFRFRDPGEHEWFLKSEGRILVAEPITADEADRQ